MARVSLPSSLRGRLLALVLVAILPSFAILIYAERNQRALLVAQVPSLGYATAARATATSDSAGSATFAMAPDGDSIALENDFLRAVMRRDAGWGITSLVDLPTLGIGVVEEILEAPALPAGHRLAGCRKRTESPTVRVVDTAPPFKVDPDAICAAHGWKLFCEKVVSLIIYEPRIGALGRQRGIAAIGDGYAYKHQLTLVNHSGPKRHGRNSRQAPCRWGIGWRIDCYQLGSLVILEPHDLLLHQGIEIEADVSTDLPVFVTDAARLKQVLVNLLGLSAEFPWRETLDALRSPYLCQSWLTPEQIGQLDQLGAQAGLGTELWRGRDHNAGDVFQYALEWAFFTRAQWGTFDTPLYELERTWSQAEPAPPLPVTLGDARPAVEKPIRSVDDVYQAVRHYLDCIPYGKLLSTAQHISTDIHYRRVSDSEMASALSRREQATSVDLDTYASFILEAFLTGLQERAGPGTRRSCRGGRARSRSGRGPRGRGGAGPR